MFNIFEEPWTLLIAAAAVLLIIFIIRALKPEKRRWWQLCIPVIIAVSAFAIDFIIETDRENINSIIKYTIKAAKNQDTNVFDAFIASDYNDSLHQSKEEVMVYCRAILSEPAVKRFLILEQSMELTSSNAAVTVKGVLFFDEKSRFYKELKPAMILKGKLSLKKYLGKKWQVNCAELLEIDNQPIDWNAVQ
jgi:hypothetical protein